MYPGPSATLAPWQRLCSLRYPRVPAAEWAGAPRGARVHGEPKSWGAGGSRDGAGREGLRIVGSLPEATFRRLAGCLAIDRWNLEQALLLIKLRDVAEKPCSKHLDCERPCCLKSRCLEILRHVDFQLWCTGEGFSDIEHLS